MGDGSSRAARTTNCWRGRVDTPTCIGCSPGSGRRRSRWEGESVGKSGPKPDDGMARLCAWAMGYAVRRKTGLAAVLATLLLRIGLDALKPWPMKLLVDHVLKGEAKSAAIADAVEWLPGA